MSDGKALIFPSINDFCCPIFLFLRPLPADSGASHFPSYQPHKLQFRPIQSSAHSYCYWLFNAMNRGEGNLKTSLIDSSTRSLLWIFIIQILIYESNTRTNLSLYDNFVISFPIRVKNFSRQELIPVNIANHVKIQHLFFCSLKEYI